LARNKAREGLQVRARGGNLWVEWAGGAKPGHDDRARTHRV